MKGRVFDDDRVADSIEGLIKLCDDWIRPNMVMAEIGCFRGVSTAIFAARCAKVYAIDPWLSRTDYFEIPRDMMAIAEAQFDIMAKAFSNIIKRKGFSVERAKEFPDESLDAVYIDGDHSEFSVDLVTWAPKVKHRGLIMGHDYSCVNGQLQRGVIIYPEESWVYRNT